MALYSIRHFEVGFAVFLIFSKWIKANHCGGDVFLQRMQVNDVFPHSWIKSRVQSRFIFHLASLTRFYDFLVAHPSLSFLLFGLIIDSRGGSCYWSVKVIQNFRCSVIIDSRGGSCHWFFKVIQNFWCSVNHAGF